MSKIDELIQELCPDGVEYRQFNEVCSLHARIGWQRLTKNEQMIDGQYMLITGTDFTSSHNLDYDTCVYVDKKRYDQDPHIQVQNGDVLITKDGTLGKVAFVRNLPLKRTRFCS
jgi:type I restriction enzyme S subunit